MKRNSTGDLINADDLQFAISELIDRSKRGAAIALNRELTLLYYWQIGHLINTFLLKEKRAAYGESIVAAVSQKLTRRYRQGFANSNLNRMINFSIKFPDREKIATLSQELSWSHFVELILLR